jgi:hypothetical protein
MNLCNSQRSSAKIRYTQTESVLMMYHLITQIMHDVHDALILIVSSRYLSILFRYHPSVVQTHNKFISMCLLAVAKSDRKIQIQIQGSRGMRKTQIHEAR